MICGGYIFSRHTRTNVCHTFNLTANRWTYSGQIKEARVFLGSSYHSRLGLVMTGGSDNRQKFLDITESTLDGSKFTSLNNMPLGNCYHCQLTINDSTIMTFGGWPNTKSHLVYNVLAGKWTQMPNMPSDHARFPGCGLVKKEAKRYVVVVGGDPGKVNVSILDLQTMTWKKGLFDAHSYTV